MAVLSINNVHDRITFRNLVCLFSGMEKEGWEGFRAIDTDELWG